MRTARRLYFYAVSLISLELVVWGVISLARNAMDLAPGASATILARGLALVLVGLPVFLLHWNSARRDAFRDDEERANRVRALFFYAALAGLLVPVAQSVLAILNRLFLQGMRLNPARAVVGGNQSAADNVISILINLLVAAYILRMLAIDWRANIPGNRLAEVRRFYRFSWMLYGLAMLFFGARLLIYEAVYRPGDTNPANGLALVLVGGPIWVYNWLVLQSAREQPEERGSLLRLVVLYLLSFAGILSTLAAAGMILDGLLNLLLGQRLTGSGFLLEQAGRIATLIPAAVIWGYFARQLRQDLEGVSGGLNRDSLRRLYAYLLALVGNITVFLGLRQLAEFLGGQLFGHLSWSAVLRGQISMALAAIAVGIVPWISTWRRVQAEAALPNADGDHARRSAIRKGYLYLVLFFSVTGAMGSAGWLLYLVISTLLGTLTVNFAMNTATWLLTFLLFLAWFLYHLAALRADNRLALRSLGDRHAAFPVLILQAGNETFTVELVQALQRLVPRMPIAVHRMELGAPGEDLLEARVVILPAWLAMQPGEALRLWLSDFHGKRVLVPRSLDDWIWLGALPRDERDLARETAQAVRQLAEGQEVRTALPSSPWTVAGYVLGAIFGLILLLFMVGLAVSTFAG